MCTSIKQNILEEPLDDSQKLEQPTEGVPPPLAVGRT